MYQDLAVYIHVPFCVKKCAYCDFLSAPPLKGQMDAYEKSLLNEIKLSAFYADNFNIKTIFIGGGTPSMYESAAISNILNVLKGSFEERRKGSYCPDEITIECNPGTLTKDKLYGYRASGINRLSIGLQSGDDDELKLLGRIHLVADWEESMRLARDAGFDNINVDLISGIPGQTVGTFEKTLNKVLKYNTEHISVYSLIVEEGTPFYDRYNKDRFSEAELDRWEEEDRKIYDMTGNVLLEHGYNRYEISNYSRKGYECKHNLVYWDRGNYIGFGLGAASLINNTRFSNTKSLSEYINTQNEIRHYDIEELSVEEQMSEYIMLGLRKTSGISCEGFKACFNKNIYDIYGKSIEKWLEKGYLIKNGDMICCSEAGLDICNIIISEMIL